MQEIEDRSEGAWRPSPGSVYPLLSQLEDEGLIRGEEHDGRKVLELTDEGRAAIADRGDRPAPWEEFSEGVDDDVRALVDVSRQAAAAVGQMVQVASREQLVAAKDILEETRRKLYGLLAEGRRRTPPSGSCAASRRGFGGRPPRLGGQRRRLTGGARRRSTPRRCSWSRPAPLRCMTAQMRPNPGELSPAENTACWRLTS